MNKQYVLAADIGGSHITAAVIDLLHNRLVEGSQRRILLDANAAAESIMENWYTVFQESMATHTGITQIGIAMPGPFDYANGISLIKGLGKYGALYGMDVRRKLAEKLSLDPENILFANDAQCALQGELFTEAVPGKGVSLGLTFGTGFGSAISYDGVTREAGYWCVPFLDSIAEEYFSTRWFTCRFEKLSGEALKDVKVLAEKAKLRNMHAIQVFYEFSLNLAAFLEDIIRREKVSRIVLNGSITKASVFFIDTLDKVLSARGAYVQLQLSALGETAALLGAAGYCKAALV